MRYVLESLYFDEIQSLLPFIRKRQLSEYKIQLSMIENPHREDPKKLWEIFDGEEHDHIVHEELDKASFDKFKSKIAQGGGLVVK